MSASDPTPVRFGDPAIEARAALESAALFDLSDWSWTGISGSDRRSFLHNFCTNDINALSPGSGCEAFLTNIKGRILAHVLVVAADDSLRLFSVPGSGAGIIEHLDRYLISEDAELQDLTAATATFFVAGPRSAEVVGDQCGVDVSELPMYAHVESASVRLIRVPMASLPGFLLGVPSESAADVWGRLTHSGLQPAGSEVWNALRIAAGFPLCGTDISDENIAQEAGRSGRAISFTKGCYLGQEPIARLDALGHVNRTLCVMRLATNEQIPAGAGVLDAEGDQEIGRITSSALDYVAGDVVALGMLKAGFAAPETKVSVRSTDGEPISGVVREGVG